MISNSLMPFHFPVSGSITTCCCAVPYLAAGAFGLSICSGLLPGANARTSTPRTSSFRSGGGGAFFLGRVGVIRWGEGFGAGEGAGGATGTHRARRIYFFYCFLTI